VAGKNPEDVARDAWGWLKQAESAYRKAEDGSREELLAIQTMSQAAQTALIAEHLANKR
jgi:hypothetical protein